MSDPPRPLEPEARSTVETYLERCSMPADVLTRAAVLYHRERYFDALELLVSHRDRLLPTDVDPGPDGPDVRLESQTDRAGRHHVAPSERRWRRA